MRVLDITLPMRSGMLIYEGDPPFLSHACSAPVRGDPDSYGVSVVTLGSHLGTHVDAPRHFVADGASITDLDLQTLCGPCRVLDLSADGLALEDSSLRRHDLAGVERLLLKTSNGALIDRPFTPQYAHLTLSAARYLRRETSVRLVAIDYLSIEAAPSPGYPVHHELLDGMNPVIIVEGVDLRGAAAGDYELYCLPLPLQGCDAAPARVVLVSRDR